MANIVLVTYVVVDSLFTPIGSTRGASTANGCSSSRGGNAARNSCVVGTRGKCVMICGGNRSGTCLAASYEMSGLPGNSTLCLRGKVRVGKGRGLVETLRSCYDWELGNGVVLRVC